MGKSDGTGGKREMVICMLVYLLIAAGVAALGVGLIALLLYRLQLPLQVVNAAVIALYVISTAVAGFLAGKKLQVRRFFWGLLMGCAFFVLLLVVSLLYRGDSAVLTGELLTTFILCAGGGMLGGMLS